MLNDIYIKYNTQKRLYRAFFRDYFSFVDFAWRRNIN